MTPEQKQEYATIKRGVDYLTIAFDGYVAAFDCKPRQMLAIASTFLLRVAVATLRATKDPDAIRGVLVSAIQGGFEESVEAWRREEGAAQAQTLEDFPEFNRDGLPLPKVPTSKN